MFLVIALGFIAFNRADRATSSLPNESAPAAVLQVPEVPSPVPTEGEPITPQPETFPTMPGGAPTPPNPFPTYVIPTITPLTIGAPDPGFDPPTPDPSAPRPQVPTPRPSDPKDVAISVERVSDIRDSTISADLIVTGSVRKVGPARWSTPDGTRPANPWAPIDSAGNQDFIFTPVTIIVDSYIKGLLPHGELQIRKYGGTIGQDSLAYIGSDLHNFVEGDRVVLFLIDPRGRGADDPNVARLNLLGVYDRFSITGDGYAVNSAHRILLQQLLDQIRAILAESVEASPTSFIP